MPDKLSQSLDEILGERRKTTGGRGRGRRAAASATAPGGIKKTTRAEKKPEKAPIPTGPSISGDGKIIVSNLVSTLRTSTDECIANTPSRTT